MATITCHLHGDRSVKPTSQADGCITVLTQLMFSAWMVNGSSLLIQFNSTNIYCTVFILPLDQCACDRTSRRRQSGFILRLALSASSTPLSGQGHKIYPVRPSQAPLGWRDVATAWTEGQ